MTPEKVKNLSEAKLRYGLPKNVKFDFCPVFGLFYDFLNNFIVRFMYEYDVTPSWFLFWWYLYSLAFSDKKIKFQKFCPCGILCPWNGNKILRFCNWYGFWYQIGFELNVIDAWFSPKRYYAIHTLWK